MAGKEPFQAGAALGIRNVQHLLATDLQTVEDDQVGGQLFPETGRVAATARRCNASIRHPSPRPTRQGSGRCLRLADVRSGETRADLLSGTLLIAVTAPGVAALGEELQRHQLRGKGGALGRSGLGHLLDPRPSQIGWTGNPWSIPATQVKLIDAPPMSI